jgi:hypothetical protein
VRQPSHSLTYMVSLRWEYRWVLDASSATVSRFSHAIGQVAHCISQRYDNTLFRSFYGQHKPTLDIFSMLMAVGMEVFE